MLKVPEESRIKNGGAYATTKLDGNNGMFLIPCKKKNKDNTMNHYFLCVVVTDGTGWENTMISIMNKDGKRSLRWPTADEIVQVKNIFWDPQDTVLQFMPSITDPQNVPQVPYTIYLWRPKLAIMPKPPKDFKIFSGKKTIITDGKLNG